MKAFSHPALAVQKEKPLIYTAHSKHSYYYRSQISKFVLEQDGVPLNPFMIFEYFLTDSVERDVVREANNNLVRRSDEVWVFGPVSDGVLAEIIQAKEQHKPVRYFAIIKSRSIEEIDTNAVVLEDDVAEYRSQL